MKPGHEAGEFSPSEGRLYLIHSEQCPHCRELMKYLNNMDVKCRIEEVKSKDYAEVYRWLSKRGIYWKGEIPFLFVLNNGNVYALSGFPAANQMNRGYFMNESYERELCTELKGVPFYNGTRYLFCRLPSGAYLGNYYSLQKIVKLCK